MHLHCCHLIVEDITFRTILVIIWIAIKQFSCD